MSEIYNFTEITKFSIGEVDATGVMQSTLTDYTGIKKGTANLNIGEPEVTDIEIEESDVAFASLDGKREADVSMELIGLTLSQLGDIIDATYTAADATDPEELAFGADMTGKIKALQISGKTSEGKAVVLNFPKVKFLVSSSNNITKDDAVGIQLKAKVLVPTNESGVKQNWLVIQTGTSTA